MAKPKFPAHELAAKDGEIYAHVFENLEAGIRRNLFWSITVNFHPVVYAGAKRFCSMTCEWIPWRIRDWRELDKKHLDVAYGDDGTESSFYMVQHDIGTRTRLWLAYRSQRVFNARMEMFVAFKGDSGGDEEPAMRVVGSTDVPFTGVLVVPDNLEPQPKGVNQIRKVATQFIDLGRYHQPKQQGHAYVFEPKV